MLDIPLELPGPVTGLPDLPEPVRPAIMAFTTYVSAVYGFQALQTQNGQGAVRWHGALLKRGVLLDEVLRLRDAGLLAGFQLAATGQLAELESLRLDPALARLRAVYLRHCAGAERDQDENGNTLPTTMKVIHRTIERAEPYKAQGMVGLTKRVRIAKHPFYAKLVEHTVLGPNPETDIIHEVAVTAMINAVQPNLGPGLAYRIHAPNGTPCALTMAVPGRAYEPEQAQQVAAMAPAATWMQLTLVEWLFGLQDRHSLNVMVDPRGRTAGIFDFSDACLFAPTFLGQSADPDLSAEQNWLSFVRLLWHHHDPAEVLARWFLEQCADAQTAMVQVGQHMGLSAPELAGLRRQFHCLQQALARYPGDIRLTDLEQTAQLCYASAESEVRE